MEYMTLDKGLKKKFKKLFKKIDDFECKYHGALPQGVIPIWNFTIPEVRVKAVQQFDNNGRLFPYDHVFNVDTESNYSFFILGNEGAGGVDLDDIIKKLPGKVLKNVKVKAYVESGFHRDFYTYFLTTEPGKFKLG